MPISHRTRRLAVYAYSDAGSDGRRAQTFVKTPSPDDDGNWWGSIVVPSGREVEIAANKGYQVDAVIGLSDEVTVDPNGVIKDAATGDTFKITAVLPRTMGHAEQQIMAQRVDDAQYTFDELGGA